LKGFVKNNFFSYLLGLQLTLHCVLLRGTGITKAMSVKTSTFSCHHTLQYISMGS